MNNWNTDTQYHFWMIKQEIRDVLGDEAVNKINSVIEVSNVLYKQCRFNLVSEQWIIDNINNLNTDCWQRIFTTHKLSEKFILEHRQHIKYKGWVARQRLSHEARKELGLPGRKRTEKLLETHTWKKNGWRKPTKYIRESKQYICTKCNTVACDYDGLGPYYFGPSYYFGLSYSRTEKPISCDEAIIKDIIE
jgi:hypothetical protein